MKLHRPLLIAVVEVVHDIFANRKMADKAIQKELKSSRRWGSKDRAFIASYSYNIVRWWRLLHFINGSQIDINDKKTIYKLLGINLILNGIELVDIPVFRGLQVGFVQMQYEEALKTRKIRESIPDWLDEFGKQELGDRWDEEINALNMEAPVGIRVNTFKTDRDTLKIILKKDSIYANAIEGIPSAMLLEERKNLFGTKAFRNGYFEVQDPGSQLIAPFLQVEPGMRVIDACAGAGGKTLHLSNLMDNKGTIISMDTEAWKLTELKRRAKRNGAHNIDTRPIESTKVIKRLKESADRLLLDVPCSGSGVLRRNPDAKWKLDRAFLNRVMTIQQDILERYPSMLKPGGIMVYATCSIFPSENQKQVQKFLQNHSAFKLLEEHNTSPYKDGYDGFYMARIQKQ
jgi:16S rRNA (cytosine967-C5)-methyltransferase